MENEKGREFMVEAGHDADGNRIGLRVRSDGTTEYQRVVPLVEGKPIHGEIVSLVGDGPVYEIQGSVSSHKGPARVSSEKYKNGWDRIFGGSVPVANC